MEHDNRLNRYLFRGKATNRVKGWIYRTDYKNGDWVYGLLSDNGEYRPFAEMTNTDGVSDIDVDKETVGQFTGEYDVNANKIFEHDIVRKIVDGKELVGIVEFSDGAFGVRFSDGSGQFLCFFADCCEVIGNIFDNSELLTICS